MVRNVGSDSDMRIVTDFVGDLVVIAAVVDGVDVVDDSDDVGLDVDVDGEAVVSDKVLVIPSCDCGVDTTDDADEYTLGAILPPNIVNLLSIYAVII